MEPLKINRKRLLETIDRLAQIGLQPNGGISRFTFELPDLEARRYVTGLMMESGLEVRLDLFGNIIGRLDNEASVLPAVACGSHIDTVPYGGPLDGAYGVLSAIEVAHRINEEKVAHKHPLEVIVFTDEEGGRFPGFLGSMGLTGFMSKENLYATADKSGISFENALKAAGYDPAQLKPALSSQNQIKCYVELHIEQGPILEKEKYQIGVIDSITGLAELEVQLEGRQAHAGTTPVSYRRDALVGAAQIVLAINEIAHRSSGNTVATVGYLSVFPNLSSVIPGTVNLVIDFRESKTKAMTQLQNEIVSKVNRIAEQNNLKAKIEIKSFTKPALSSTRVMEAINRSAESLGLSKRIMHSGAGHDCQLMAGITEVGMIFVPSHDGVSHAPSEFTRPEDLENGANVLLNAVLRLAN